MPTTINNTLPNDWDSSTTYHLGDLVSYAGIIYKCLQTCTNKNPATYSDYWSPLAVYMKDSTVMPHGDYSGDESFWERDQIYIDDNGWVYVNNENTGINVQGKSAVSVSFDELTPAQRESLRGPRGFTGPQGATGAQGPQGPMGEVVLTPEQIEALTGPQGKSAYQSWLDTGHTGSESDFVAWLRSGIIKLDTAMSTTSTNGVQNKVITTAFNNYKLGVNEILQQFANRIADLENRLKAEYNSEEYNFKFGMTSEGKYGYVLMDTDTVIPFDAVDNNILLTSSSAIPSLLIASENFGYSSDSPVYETVGDIGNIEPTSLRGVVSNSTGIDTNPVYGTNVQLMSLEEGLGLYYNVFNSGSFDADYPFNLYGMTYDEVDKTDIISEDTHNIEGILFDVTAISTKANHIYFEVEPINTAEIINYRIGTFTSSSAELPDIAVRGSTYTEGSFSSRTTIDIQVPSGSGVYFASTSGGDYKITRIYLS